MVQNVLIYTKGVVKMEYSEIVSLVTDVVKTALPIGIIFLLAERLVQLFLSLAFPKMKGGM